MIELYGIPNCDTVRKARAWLDACGRAYRFNDYKKLRVDPARLEAWSDAVGWEALLNRRGATFRALAEADKSAIDRSKALVLMEASPSLIKRPVVEYPGGVLVGFDPAAWSAALGTGG